MRRALSSMSISTLYYITACRELRKCRKFTSLKHLALFTVCVTNISGSLTISMYASGIRSARINNFYPFLDFPFTVISTYIQRFWCLHCKVAVPYMLYLSGMWVVHVNSQTVNFHFISTYSSSTATQQTNKWKRQDGLHMVTRVIN